MAPVLFFALASLLAGHSLASSPRVVSMPIRHSRTNHSAVQHDKRDPFAVSIQNLLAGHQYFATGGVGTPAQDIELVIDTGSSDTWMFATNTCHTNKAGPCIGGEFDSSSSSSFKSLPNLGQYKNRYGDGSKVQGPFFSDNFAIGGETVKALTMGLVNKASGIIRSGIMGIGLDTNEGRVAFGKSAYPNLPDLLVSQGLIASKSFSLYLDNLADATGSVLFGGYDSDKYEGEMIMLPLQNDPFTGVKDAYFVSLTAFGVSGEPKTGKGKTIVISSPHDPYPIPALLDSGTENINIPLEMFEPLISLFDLKPLERGEGGLFLPFQVDCSLPQQYGSNTSIIFAFGSNSGPLIAIPIRELVVPFYNPVNGKQVHLRGQPFCRFGIAASGPGSPTVLGQTFLRSAYALYDLENKAVGLAQAKFDSKSSNIKEYSASSSNQGVVVDSKEPKAVSVPYAATSYFYDIPKTADFSATAIYIPAPADTAAPPAAVAASPTPEPGKYSDSGAGGSLSDGASSGNNGAGTLPAFSPSASLLVAGSMLAALISAMYML